MDLPDNQEKDQTKQSSGADLATALSKSFDAVNSAAHAFQAYRASIDNLVRRILPPIAELRAPLLSPELRERLRVLAEESRKGQQILDAGFLPNRFVPWQLVNFEGDADLHPDVISQVLRQEWDGIRNQLESDAETQTHDDLGATVLKEALAAHEHGLNRAVVRLIMPEIERIIRQHFGDGRVDDTWISKKFLKDAGELPVGLFFGISGGFTTYSHVSEHLFASVKTMDDVARYSNDSIPNRHATIHAVVPYDTWQASVNAIFLLDFILVLTGRVLPYATPQE